MQLSPRRRFAAAPGAALVLVLQLLAAAARADAPARSPEREHEVTETSGLAIGVAIPTGAGLIGVRADYLFQLPHTLFRLGLHAGVGAYLCAEPECHPSYSFGALGSWGHQHRVVLQAAAATVGGVSLYLHGQSVASRAVWGVDSELGYEYMGSNGFFIRFSVGIVLLLEATIEPLSERFGPTLTLLHVGCKLW